MKAFTRWAAVAALAIPSFAMADASHADFVLFGTSKPSAELTLDQSTIVHPITTPYYHEDSFVTTDIRAWGVYHSFPKNGLINGGSAKDYAVQVRVAITDQLQFVAYKDGYMDYDAGLLGDSGYNDVAAGLKWNFLQDWKHELHAAVGVGYQFPVGDTGSLQNNQEARVWGSVNKGFGPLHLGVTANGLFSTGSPGALGSSNRFVWNAHADYYTCKWFSPVIEASGFYTFDKGTEVLPYSGLDVADFGGGDDVVTLGLGGEFRPLDRLAIRAAYELPLTDGTDLYGWRVTVSAVYSF